VTEFIASVSALVALGVLLSAGVGHSLHLQAVAGLIREQSVWSAGHETVVAVAALSSELLLSLIGLTMILVDWGSRYLPLILLSAAAVYIAFALYASYLVRKRPGAPCACSAKSDAASGHTVWRAAVLAGLSLAASALSDKIIAPLHDHGVMVGGILVAACVGLAVPLWTLPAALRNPFDQATNSSSFPTGGPHVIRA
jgi:hypothetical protein